MPTLAGGLLSLENLAWFAEKQPRVFQRLMAKQDGERSEWEYPFAAAVGPLDTLNPVVSTLEVFIPADKSVGESYIK